MHLNEESTQLCIEFREVCKKYSKFASLAPILFSAILRHLASQESTTDSKNGLRIPNYDNKVVCQRFPENV